MMMSTNGSVRASRAYADSGRESDPELGEERAKEDPKYGTRPVRRRNGLS